eukprot:scaffold7925_cov81-Skeletonema_dohrnii-CCMP3373.AAC.4
MLPLPLAFLLPVRSPPKRHKGARRCSIKMDGNCMMVATAILTAAAPKVHLRRWKVEVLTVDLARLDEDQGE